MLTLTVVGFTSAGAPAGSSGVCPFATNTQLAPFSAITVSVDATFSGPFDDDAGWDAGDRHRAINHARGSGEVHRLRGTRSLLVDAEEEVSLLLIGRLAVHGGRVADGLQRHGCRQRLVLRLSRDHIEGGADTNHHAREKLHS